MIAKVFMKLKRFPAYIVHEDEHLIAINKPAMISSLHDRIGDQPSIQHSGTRLYLASAQLCHRLDKETSGILLTHCKRCGNLPRDVNKIRKKRNRKNVLGYFRWPSLLQEHHSRHTAYLLAQEARAKVDKRDGKPAETDFSVIETFKHFCLIECKPVTGRSAPNPHSSEQHRTPQSLEMVIYGGDPPLSEDQSKRTTTRRHMRSPAP